MEGIEKYLFMRPLLGLLAQGRFFRRVVAMAIRAGAALVVLFSLTTFFQAGKLTFELPAQGIPGAVLFEVLFVLAVYAVVHVMLIRARDVDQLSVNDFYAIPLGAILVRMLGEIYAVFVGLVSIGAGLFVWFTNQGVGKVLNPLVRALFPTMRDNPSFMGGIEFMVSGMLAGLGVLIAAYVVSEILALLARLAAREAQPKRSAQSVEPIYKSRFGS
jgi:hypothetical protein